MAHPGNAVAAGILEYSYLLVSVYGCYTSGQSGVFYVLGVFAIESSRLIGICIYIYAYYLLLDINTFFPRTKTEKQNVCHGN